MKTIFSIIVLIICLSLSISLLAEELPTFLRISQQDIKSVQGKVILKWIRNWGGDDEDGDVDKYFKGPMDVVVNGQKQIIICDKYRHCLKIFSKVGDLIRTIGRFGQGPGDLYGPFIMQTTASDDIYVLDSLKWRLQRFDCNGHSKEVLKIKTSMFLWFDITSSGELLVYDRDVTFKKKILLMVLNSQGEQLRSIGLFDDPMPNPLLAELLYFAKDKSDNIYVLNTMAPVIRKYSKDGRLLMAITTEPPYENQIRITMNSSGTEIVRHEKLEPFTPPKLFRKREGLTINNTFNKRSDYRHTKSISVDEEGKIYVLALSKFPVIDPKKRCTVAIGATDFKVFGREYRDTEVIDYYQLLVYNQKGAIIGATPVNRRCDKIRVFGNRLFIVEGLATQRISEFEIILK